ncbi:ATP8A1 [Symbiodinium natans]|uniref:ATP8A1 protein n=1 Tax=Symbiodinium natans TaxID=878477 RepID=A0A812VBD9_9DINO|nr:ATP8A1 [Symbiodinium natans]
MVIVRQNEYVPADLVLLTTSHEEGHVYIETANLDGETNLKTKQAPARTFKMVGQHETMEEAARAASQIDMKCECELPNEFLYTFAGNIKANSAGGEQNVSLDEQHVVLRGCKIKNISWCLGVVVYSGSETKIMMNSKNQKGRKLSHLERDVGRLTLLVFAIQNVLCLIAAIASAMFETSEDNLKKMYLNLTDENGNAQSAFLVLLIRFFNFIILFSNFIPISLLVSMSLAKLAQVFFFYADEDMLHQGIRCMPRTSDLNEELGQVEYVFSDKTGTLTCNVMDFRKFCVKGITYGQGMTEIKRQAALPLLVMMKMGKTVEETPHVDLVDPRVDDLLRMSEKASPLKKGASSRAATPPPKEQAEGLGSGDTLLVRVDIYSSDSWSKEQLLHGTMDRYGSEPTQYIPTVKSILWFLSYHGLQVLSARFMPGVLVQTNGLDYPCNGYLTFYASLLGAGLLHACGLFDLTTLVKEYPSFMSTAIILGDIYSVVIHVCYAKGKELESIYAFFMGTALHPRVGKLVDVKMVAETRLSWTLLLLITLGCYVETSRLTGSWLNPTAFMVLAHFLYGQACAKGEHFIPYTWDITTEKFGWMLCWWNLAGVPLLYCYQSLFLCKNSWAGLVLPPLPGLYYAVISVLLVLMYALWDEANYQKCYFKAEMRPIVQGLGFRV